LPSSTPTVTSTPCGIQVVRIYDERGEMVAQLCGSLVFPEETGFSLSLSNFVPNPSGPGGTIAVYLNGQIVTTWDTIGKNGEWVPNSYYHFVVEQHAADGRTVVLARDAFVAPYHGQDVSLAAQPNVGYKGGTIVFYASFAGVPADARSNVKIYTVAGELVRTIQVTDGTVTWSLEGDDGQPVASGVYLALLEGIEPTSGQKLTKITKVLVIH
jgi:hypothetical protein